MTEQPQEESSDPTSSFELEHHPLPSPLEMLQVQPNNDSDDDADDDDADSYDSEEGGIRGPRKRKRRRRKFATPLYAMCRYVGLSLLALLLAVTCPETEIYHPRTGSSHTDSSSIQNWQPVLQMIVVYVLTMLSFFLVHGSSPGYVTQELMQDFHPDNMTLLEYEEQQQQENTTTISNSNSHESCVGESSSLHETSNMAQQRATRASPSSSRRGVVQPITSNEYFQGTRRKRCDKCQLAPPLRSHHCKACEKCVATFDHHCDFIGTCIGEGNHARFWCFLLVQAIAFQVLCHVIHQSNLGLTTALPSTTSSSSSHTNTIPWWPLLRVVAAKLYLYPLTFVAWCMWVVHTCMAVTNSTTFEWSKGARHIDYLKGTQCADLPFSKGLCQNLRIFCCERDAMVAEWFNCSWFGNSGGGGSVCCSRSSHHHDHQRLWTPKLWQPPGKIIRDSDDVWEHPWQNKYWSCC